MVRDSDVSRRKVMKITGATAATALVAGCGGGGNGGDDDGGNGGDDTGNGGNGGDQAIEPDTQIVFSAQASGWEGKEPSDIEGETNPPLTLQAGETYTIGFDEVTDGAEHNIMLWNENEEVVQDYETELTSDAGDGVFIEGFEATDEIAYYRCDPHPQMQGEIEIVEGNGGGNGNSSEDGNESGDGNSSE